MEDNSGSGIERREFIGRCGSVLQALLFAGVAGPLIQACETTQILAPRLKEEPKTVEIDVSGLDADGEFLVSTQLGLDGQPILVIRKSAAIYLAMSMRCTHQGCRVNPPEADIIHCECHGSEYDMEGAVVQGPAPLALTRYAAVYSAADAKLTVTL